MYNPYFLPPALPKRLRFAQKKLHPRCQRAAWLARGCYSTCAMLHLTSKNARRFRALFATV